MVWLMLSKHCNLVSGWQAHFNHINLVPGQPYQPWHSRILATLSLVSWRFRIIAILFLVSWCIPIIITICNYRLWPWNQRSLFKSGETVSLGMVLSTGPPRGETMVCWLLGVKVVHNGNSYTPRQTIGSPHLSPAVGGRELSVISGFVSEWAGGSKDKRNWRGAMTEWMLNRIIMNDTVDNFADEKRMNNIWKWMDEWRCVCMNDFIHK